MSCEVAIHIWCMKLRSRLIVLQMETGRDRHYHLWARDLPAQCFDVKHFSFFAGGIYSACNIYYFVVPRFFFPGPAVGPGDGPLQRGVCFDAVPLYARNNEFQSSASTHGNGRNLKISFNMTPCISWFTLIYPGPQSSWNPSWEASCEAIGWLSSEVCSSSKIYIGGPALDCRTNGVARCIENCNGCIRWRTNLRNVRKIERATKTVLWSKHLSQKPASHRPVEILSSVTRGQRKKPRNVSFFGVLMPMQC